MVCRDDADKGLLDCVCVFYMHIHSLQPRKEFEVKFDIRLC